MNVSAIRIILIVLFLSHTLCADDGILINEKFDNIPLKEVFQIFKDKYQLKIAFAEKYTRDIRVNAEIRDLGVHDTFRLILENTPLAFEVIDGNAIIVKRKHEIDPAAGFLLNGVVKDSGTGETLPYAYVWAEPEKANFTTNVEGFFSIPLVRDSTRLRISYLGYQDTIIHISENNRERRLQVELWPVINELEEIVVQDEESRISDYKIEDQPGKITFATSIIPKMPSAGEVDVFRSLQLLPGINATNEVSSGLSINGGTSNQNLVLFDGFTVYHVDHFFGYFSAFNPNAVKSLQLYKTGFDAKYGGRVSSVVDIVGKDGNRNKTSGSLGLNLLSVNSSIEIPLSDNGATLFFSARRSFTDIWSSSLFENIFSIFEGNISENQSGTDDEPDVLMNSIIPDFYYADLNLKFSTKVGPKNHLSFSFYDSNDILNYKESIYAEFDDTLTVDTKNLGIISWGNVGTSLTFSRLWNSRHYSKFLGSYSFYESDFSEQSTSNVDSEALGEYDFSTMQDQHNSIGDLTLKLYHDWDLNEFLRIEAGLEGSLYNTIMRYDVDDSTFVDEGEEDELLFAQFIQGTLNPGTRLSLTTGLRTSYLSSTGQTYFDPRVSFSFALLPSLSLQGAAGIYHQFINQSNTRNVLDGSRDFWIMANDQGIPVQKAKHFLLGANFSVGVSNLGVSFFQKDFEGLMEYAFINGSLITEFDDPGSVFVLGEGRSQGIEVLLKHDFGPLNGWITYTLAEVKYKFPGLSNGESFFADYDQRHEVNFVGIYTLGRLDFSTSWVYGSGKPYTNYTGLVEKPGNGKGKGKGPPVTTVETQEKNGERLPPYHRMDVSSSYNFQLGAARARLSLSVLNLYDRENVLDKKVTIINPGNSQGQGNAPKKYATQNDLILMGTTFNISMEVRF